MLTLQIDNLLIVFWLINSVKNSLRGTVILHDDAVLLESLVIFMVKLIQKVFQVCGADLAHNDEMRNVLVHLLKFRTSPG